MLKRLILALLVCVLPTFAVDTLTVTAVGGQFSKIEWNWTADGSGNASGVTTDVCPGVLFSFSTVPDTVQVPTDNYDITIKNQLPSVTGSDVTLATDLAGGLIADRDNVNTELVEFWPTGIRQSSGKIRLDISNAGSGKKGKAVLVIYRTLAIVSTSGSFQVPIGGATTQMLQWFSSGQAKWITLSGDATIANGGAITIANGAITRAKTAITGTPTGSKFLRDDWSWQAPGGGSGVGDVVGPASATNGGIVLFDLTTGKLIKDSTYTFPLADAQVADALTASIFKGSGTTTDAVDLATAEVAGTLPAASVGNGLTDAQVSDTLTASIFKGSGTTTNAVDLATAEVAGTLPAASVGNGLTDAQVGNDLTIASSNPLSSTGDITAGSNAGGDRYYYANAAAGSYRGLRLQTAGSVRWHIGSDNGAESGSNAGTAFRISAFTDAGSGIDVPMSIVRALGGAFTIGRPLTLSSSSALTVNSLAVAVPKIAGTWKTSTPVWLSAASITPTTTAGCTAPAVNATDSWAAAMAASTNGFWQITIPADYDGSTENVSLWYYKSDTNAVQWTISEIDFGDNTADTTTYNAGTSQSDTPVANNIQAVSISASTLFGSTSNAGRIAKVKVSTNAYTGTTAYLMGVKIEY